MSGIGTIGHPPNLPAVLGTLGERDAPVAPTATSQFVARHDDAFPNEKWSVLTFDTIRVACVNGEPPYSDPYSFYREERLRPHRVLMERQTEEFQKASKAAREQSLAEPITAP